LTPLPCKYARVAYMVITFKVNGTKLKIVILSYAGMTEKQDMHSIGCCTYWQQLKLH